MAVEPHRMSAEQVYSLYLDQPNAVLFGDRRPRFVFHGAEFTLVVHNVDWFEFREVLYDTGSLCRSVSWAVHGSILIGQAQNTRQQSAIRMQPVFHDVREFIRTVMFESRILLRKAHGVWEAQGVH